MTSCRFSASETARLAISGRGVRRPGFTWLELLVAIVVIGGLLALLLPTATRSREAARRSQCRNNLKQIGLALHNYHDAYGSFPPAFTVDAEGRRLHSWRTLILPYLDGAPLYNKLDLTKPWDDPVNKEAFQTVVQAYRCPSTNLDPDRTIYVVVVMPDGGFRGAEPTRIEEFEDGTSITLLVVEASPDRAVRWMEPVDIEESAFLQGGKTPSAHIGGYHCLRGDGAVRFQTHEEIGRYGHAWLTIAGGEKIEE